MREGKREGERERERERGREGGRERGRDVYISLALFWDSILKRLSADSASVAMAFSLTILRKSLIPEKKPKTITTASAGRWSLMLGNLICECMLYPWELTERFCGQFLIQTVRRERRYLVLANVTIHIVCVRACVCACACVFCEV